MPEAQPHRLPEEHAWGGTGYGDVQGHIKLDVPYPWGTATSLYPWGTATSLSSGSTAMSVVVVLADPGRVSSLEEATVNAEWRELQTQRIGDPAYEPARTPLGAELRLSRARIVESGEPLLSWEDIERITAELRGD